MVRSGFLEKWIGVCRRRRRTPNQSHSQLKKEEEEDPLQSETRIEEDDDGGGLVEIVVDTLPKDEPGCGIRRLPSSNVQRWFESKARLMKLGFMCLQNCAGAIRRGKEGSFHLEEQDETRRSLPNEIVVDILIRVSFKTLLRCRCVCKSWLSLISQPSFIKMQILKNHNKTNGDDEIGDYVVFSNKKVGSSDFNFHSWCGYGCVTKKLPLPIKPSLGFRHFVPSGVGKFRPCCPLFNRTSLVEFEVLGSCNGLLCLISYDGAILWNPALNKMRRVVEENEMSQMGLAGLSVAVGLCFIPQTVDFKVVKIGHGYGTKPPDVRIYSTSTNSWKVAAHNDSREWMITQQGPPPFVEGALHWCAGQMLQKEVILCFDVLEEAFHEIDVPGNKRITKIKEFQGTIACFLDDRINQSWEVWVMSVYGVEDTWTMLYTFGYAHGIPREIMNDGEVMVTSSNGYFLLFDLTTQNHRREIEVNPGCHDMVAYKGSLALLNEGNQSRICLWCSLILIILLVQCIGMVHTLLIFCLSD